MTDTSPHPPQSDHASPVNGATQPGLWLVVFGCLMAFLAPLGGFLGGTMRGSTGGGQDINAMTMWLVAGLGVGGIGVFVTLIGGMRWMRANRQRSSTP